MGTLRVHTEIETKHMRIVTDTFPANCVLADNTYLERLGTLELNDNALPQGVYRVSRARVFVTDTTVAIAVDTPEGPELIFREDYKHRIAPIDKNVGVHHIRTVSGKSLAWQRDDNCGCGSRLRNWDPYKIVTTTRK